MSPPPVGNAPLKVVALGDSLSCGEGVGIHVPSAQTWVTQLARAVPDAELSQLAVAGARAADVRREQLPNALSHRPALATVLVGLNDISRPGFHPDRFRDDLSTITRALRAAGATVLLATLHDPGALCPLPLPPQVRRHLLARVTVVNDIVSDLAAGDDGIRVLDLPGIAPLRRLGAWEVDRVHPSPAGHRLMAAAAVEALAGGGLPRLAPIACQPMPRAAGRRARARWILTCGVPWLVRHGGRVAPTVLTMRHDGQAGSAGHDPVSRADDRGPFQTAAGEPPLGRVRTGFGEHAGTPEVARSLG
jgi:lysophospholipase L1-like esterase